MFFLLALLALLTGTVANGVVQSISLQKQYVPVMRGDKIMAYKTSYFGKIYLGSRPDSEPFTAVFDTGSGHLILPSATCTTETCLKHKTYDRTASATAVDIEYDGTVINATADERDQVSIAFGTGSVLGEFIEEVVCIDATAVNCMKLRIVLATDMSPEPFGQFAFDGVLGLGLGALALNDGFSFMSQLIRQQPEMLPQFSVFLARTDAGESRILFGGHDKQLATAELEWAPVAMSELGYWQVQVKRVLIGDRVLEECEDGTCRAIVDSGTSLLGVPREISRTMHRLLARKVSQDHENPSDIDCRHMPGAMIHFELGSNVISLGPEEYSRPVPFNISTPNTTETNLYCRSLLLPLDMAAPLGPKVFIWGEPVLKRYYTVYDWANKQIGFSIAAGGSERPAMLPAMGAPPSGSLVSGSPITEPLPSKAELTI